MPIGTFGLVSQTSLNFSTGDGFRVLVGTLDITNCITGLTLKRPIAEITTPQTWTGSLNLSTPLVPSLVIESLDDLINPARWARGQHPVKIYFRDTLFATVRIMEYFYNEDELTGEAELGDMLTLLDYRSPAQDYTQNFRPCESVPLQNIAIAGLQAAGVPQFQITIPGTIAVPPDKPSGSWIKWVQSYLGERGYWLYCDQNEVVKAVQYPLNPTPLFAKPRTLVEKFERERSPEYPPEKLTVTATGQKFNICDGEEIGKPNISEEFGPIKDKSGNEISGVLISRTTTTLVKKPLFNFTQGNEDTRAEIRTTKVEQALAVIFPKTETGNTSVVTSSFTTEKKRYNDRGFLEKELRLTDKLLGLCLPDAFDGDKQFIPEAEKTITDYSEMIPGIAVISGLGPGKVSVKPGMPNSGILVYKKTDSWTLYADGTKATKLEGGGSMPQNTVNWYKNTNTLTIEQWFPAPGKQQAINSPLYATESEDEACQCNEVRYTKQVYKRPQIVLSATEIEIQGKSFTEDTAYYLIGGLSLSSKDSSSQNGTTFPNWDKVESPCPVCQVALKSSANFAPKDFSPFRDRESTIQADTLNTSAECQYLATLLGTIAHQRYRQRLINMPFPDQYLGDPKPFTCADIHIGRFILDAPSVVVATDGTEVSWTGNYVGAIPAVPPLKRLPIWIPTEGETGGQLTSMNYPEPVDIQQNQYIAIPVLGAGGTFPYNYIFTGLPPGMGVSGQTTGINPATTYPPVITGSPTTPGDYTVAVTVTDFCGVITTSYLTISVDPPVNPNFPIVQRQTIISSAFDTSTLIATIPLIRVTSPPIYGSAIAGAILGNTPLLVISPAIASTRLFVNNHPVRSLALSGSVVFPTIVRSRAIARS